MSTETLSLAGAAEKSSQRDPYRFGYGPGLELRPGTLGWSASDLDDPQVYHLFDQGRFEILNGVLTKLPPAHYNGGACADNLKYLLRDHLLSQGIPYSSSSEVDLEIDQERYLRADAVCVFGPDIASLEQHAAQRGQHDWMTAALVVGPSLIIESVSQGHEAHDRKTKRQWYAELGAKRYWIVDAFARSLECLLLQGASFIQEGVGQQEEVVTVPSVSGLQIPLKQVWAR